MGSEVQGSPHRAPAAAAWAACRAYLLMLSLPGAAAYGILQPAVLGLVLTNLRAWCRSSAVYASGGATAAVVIEGVGDAVGGAGAGAGGKKQGQQKRRRGGGAGAGSDSESDGGGGEGTRGGGRRKRRTVAVRGGGGDERGGSCGDVEACLRLLKACLACVPLASHQVSFCCCFFSCGCFSC